MSQHYSPTGYARLTPLQARAVLAATTLLLVFCVGITLSPLASSNPQQYQSGPGDVALYLAEIDRIHAGEGYYQAAAAELTSRGYPTRSVFNWRTPLPMWLLGRLPTAELGKGLLGLLALALMFVAFEALAREENIKPRPVVAVRGATPRPVVAVRGATPRPVVAVRGATTGRGFMLTHPVACALLLTGPLLPTILGDLFVLPVLWAGVLIALSACAYGINRPGWGVALGLAAVFFRELALPYCVLAAAIALWHRRRGEVLAWAVGLVAWLLFFGLHWLQVSQWIAPDARMHRERWLQWGGAGFVISTVQMNVYLLLLPQWVTAIYFVAAMAGFAGWHTPLGTRIGLSTCLFVAAFAVVGHNFNQYWGSLIAPLLCFGVARFPASLRDLCRAAARTGESTSGGLSRFSSDENGTVPLPSARKVAARGEW